MTERDRESVERVRIKHGKYSSEGHGVERQMPFAKQ